MPEWLERSQVLRMNCQILTSASLLRCLLAFSWLPITGSHTIQVQIKSRLFFQVGKLAPNQKIFYLNLTGVKSHGLTPLPPPLLSITDLWQTLKTWWIKNLEVEMWAYEAKWNCETMLGSFIRNVLPLLVQCWQRSQMHADAVVALMWPLLFGKYKWAFVSKGIIFWRFVKICNSWRILFDIVAHSCYRGGRKKKE